MEKKQIAIIGAGIAGLVACKYCISKGFEPIVFEFESHIGGVWAKTLKDTRLQIPKSMYQFSDYPWPASVTHDLPTQQEVIDYFHSYAKHFQLMQHINFCSRVKGISYDGPSSDSWVLWNGTGEPFPPQGKWNITVENTKTATTQVYTVDFVILCIGRYKDVPNMPKFPQGKGLDVFQGKAIHSLQYATLDNDAAEELVKGKKVVVVGFGKSGLDISRGCAKINGPEHPCTSAFAALGNAFLPRIPQLGIIGTIQRMGRIYGEASEASSTCLHSALGSIVEVWYSDPIEIWYSDLLCKDMGVNPIRKKGLFANMFEAYGPADYADI
ncbi:N-oxide-forming dimethylaniline monooxygenase [Tanacetum coccineum]